MLLVRVAPRVEPARPAPRGQADGADAQQSAHPRRERLPARQAASPVTRPTPLPRPRATAWSSADRRPPASGTGRRHDGRRDPQSARAEGPPGVSHNRHIARSSLPGINQEAHDRRVTLTCWRRHVATVTLGLSDDPGDVERRLTTVPAEVPVRRVLLLNVTYEPLTTVGLRRAVCLVLCGKGRDRSHDTDGEAPPLRQRHGGLPLRHPAPALRADPAPQSRPADASRADATGQLQVRLLWPPR